VNIAVPPITRHWVLIPAGFPFDSLSTPMAKPAASAMPISTKNRSSYPVGMLSRTNQAFDQLQILKYGSNQYYSVCNKKK
jgi:uncharacterized protein YgbK (DUF1537 family)